MGLLVAGITGGASLIDAARITSVKRELDDYVRDAFTFYSRVGRLPGDLQNTGILGYMSGHTYSATSFSEPYNVTGIKAENAPFIELYLYGISSFRPDHSKVSTVGYGDVTNSVLPLSKVYKSRGMSLLYRGNSSGDGCSSYFRCGMNGKPGIELLCVYDCPDKQMLDIAKKIEAKFDDGVYNSGNIRGYCGLDGGTTGYWHYDASNRCSEIVFYFSL